MTKELLQAKKEAINRQSKDWYYINLFTNRRIYRDPPKITEEDTKVFVDTLKEIIPEKLEECLKEARLVKRRFHKDIKENKENYSTNSFTKYLYDQIAAGRFAEYFQVQKWIAYWLRLSSLAKIRTPIKYKKIDDVIMHRAKQSPIENYYYGKLKKSGTHLMGECPFHKEKTGSFTIYTETNTYHCFGCKVSGDSIKFVMETEHLPFYEAVRRLI